MVSRMVFKRRISRDNFPLEGELIKTNSAEKLLIIYYR